MIFKYADIYNAPSRVIKHKNKAAKCKLKGLKNNTLGKRCAASKSRAGKKTFKKPFNKNLSSTSSDTLLANSNDNYNKDELEMVDPQLLIEDMAVSSGTFDVRDDDNNYINNLIKLKLPLEFLQVLNYKYRFWQYTHMHQLTRIYYDAVKVAREI